MERASSAPSYTLPQLLSRRMVSFFAQVCEEHSDSSAIIHLSDSWSSTPLVPTDVINIIMAQDVLPPPPRHASVPLVLATPCSLPPPPAVTLFDDTNGMLLTFSSSFDSRLTNHVGHLIIHHPDVLVSATQVGEGFVCTR